jgi:DNA adenine methylase
MRTPITYYGGKQRLASTILSMISAHKIYCEPYFGGGAVFFAKAKYGLEVINDHDGRLINFYLCMQNKFYELQDMVNWTLCSEEMYKHAKDIWNGRVIEASDVEKAWAVWMITNGSFAGSMYGGWKWDNGTSGSHTGIFMAGKRADFSTELHRRLENVQISCRDALKVIADRDTPDTFFYLDPPYPNCYQGHYAGYNEADLKKLLIKLVDLKGKFILSNYWSDTLRYYVDCCGWNYKEVDMSMRLTNLGHGCRPERGSQRRTEVLVYNYDIEPTLF